MDSGAPSKTSSPPASPQVAEAAWVQNALTGSSPLFSSSPSPPSSPPPLVPFLSPPLLLLSSSSSPLFLSPVFFSPLSSALLLLFLSSFPLLSPPPFLSPLFFSPLSSPLLLLSSLKALFPCHKYDANKANSDANWNISFSDSAACDRRVC